MRHSNKVAEMPRPSETSLINNEPLDTFAGHEPYVDELVIAQFIGIEPRRVLDLARPGLMPAHPLGAERKTWRFLVSEVDEWMRRTREKARTMYEQAPSKKSRGTMTTAVPGAKEKRLG